MSAMPIEIRELIIRTTVTPDAQPGHAVFGREELERLKREIVAEVTAALSSELTDRLADERSERERR